MRLATTAAALTATLLGCAETNAPGTLLTSPATASPDVTSAPTPDTSPEPLTGCAALACPAGAHCVDSACVTDAPPPCMPAIDRVVMPAFARLTTDVVLHGDVVLFSTALGLEIYAKDAAPDAQGHAPTPIAWVALDGAATALAVEANIVAVAHGKDGVTLIDVATASAPVVLGRVPVAVGAAGVALVGHHLYVADGATGLVIWDVSVPTLPVWTGAVATGQRAQSVLVRDGVAYVAAATAGLVLVDVADATAPTVLGTFPTNAPLNAGEAVRVRAVGTRLYVAARYAGLHLFDVSEPKAPTKLGTYIVENNNLIVSDVSVDPTTQIAAVVATYFRTIHLVDVSDGAAPKLVSVSKSGASAVAIGRSGSTAWLAGGGILRFDLAAPGGPAELANFGPKGGDETRDVTAVDGRVYVAQYVSGLQIIEAAPAPRVIGALAMPLPTMSVAVHGSRAYVGLDATYPMILRGELHVVDLSVPEAPVAQGKVIFAGRPAQVRWVGPGLVYVTTGELQVIDVSDPKAPSIVTTVHTNHSFEGMDLQGDVLALTRRYNDVQFYDVSDRKKPVLLGSFDTPGHAIDVALAGTVAYIADGNSGVRVLDVSEPKAPKALSAIALPGHVGAVAVADQRLWFTGDGLIRAFDVSDPARPLPLASIPSVARAPVGLALSEATAWVIDRDIPLAGLSLACVPSTSSMATPTAELPSTVQLVNVLAGADALDVVSDAVPVAATLGFAQGVAVTVPKGPLAWQTPASAQPLLVSELARETAVVVATGIVTAPAQLRLPAIGLPAADAARLRVTNATSTSGLLGASVRRGAQTVTLGSPAAGQSGPATDLVGPGAWELTIALAGETLVMPLPVLGLGHTTEAIVARTPEGRAFVVLQRDDGLTRQVGAPDHLARWRFVNLTDVPVTARLEAEPQPKLEAVATLGTSGTVGLWPGTKHVELTHATTGAALGSVAALPLPYNTQWTTVLVRSADGTLATITTRDFSGQQTKNSTTEIQLTHAVPGVGEVDLVLLAHDGSWGATPKTLPFATAVGFGEVTSILHPKTGSYHVGVDLDRDGSLDHVFDVGYFPDYGMSLILARGLDGRLRLGVHSPADGPVYWRYANDQLANVRVVNLTSKPNLEVLVPTWYEQSSPSLVPAQSSSGRYGVLAGSLTVTLREPQSKVEWSWTGAIGAEQRLSVVFWEQADGTITTLSTDDTLVSGTAVRVVHLAPKLGSVKATLIPAEGTAGIGLGTMAPLGQSAAVATTLGVTAGRRVALDTNADGQDDLSFAVNEGAGDTVTNVYLVEDATWPFARVHGQDYLMSASYAEELQARVQVVYLPDAQLKVTVTADGAGDTPTPVASFTSKAAYGVKPAVFYGVGGVASLLAGERTLTVTVDGVVRTLKAALPGQSRHMLLIAGAKSDPWVTLLSEPDNGADAVTVVHAALGTPAVSAFAQVPGATTFTALGSPLAYGQMSPAIPLSASGAVFALDRTGDGVPDWKSKPIGGKGHTWLLIAGPAEAPALLPVSFGGYAWLGGDVLK